MKKAPAKSAKHPRRRGRPSSRAYSPDSLPEPFHSEFISDAIARRLSAKRLQQKYEKLGFEMNESGVEKAVYRARRAEEAGLGGAAARQGSPATLTLSFTGPDHVAMLGLLANVARSLLSAVEAKR